MRFSIVALITISCALNIASANDTALKEKANQVGVDFFKENITLAVNDSEASVKGVYYFRNNTDKEGNFPVLFPFYVDSLSLYPKIIRPYIKKGNKIVVLDFQKIVEAGSISLEIPLKPHSVTAWCLDYIQTIKSNRACYIITSTNAWGKPLEEADYKFIAPIEFDSISVWPEQDSIIKEGGKQVWICHKRKFLPSRDMEISWKKK